MRLTACEYFKLFSNKIFMLCLAVSFAVNLSFLAVTQYSDIENSAVIKNREYYETLIDECKNADNIEDLVESKQTEIQIAYLLFNGSESALETIEKYKASNPDEYANAIKLNLSSDELSQRQLLLMDMISQNTHIKNYDEFINNMEFRAENQHSFSIFAQNGSFSYNNIEKTPKDFSKLKGIELELGNNKALDVSTSFALTDYLVLILIIFICIIVFSVEREKGLYSLVRCSKHGRQSTIVKKLIVAVSVSTAISLAFYTGNILTSGVLFGFGDLHRSIQSDSNFINCSFNFTILDYIFIWLAGKTIIFASFTFLISFIFVAVKTTSKTYAVIAAFLVFEFFTYYFVDGTSVFGFLKYLNFIYLMTGNNIFGYYLNVNVFSVPINISVVFYVVSTLMIVIGFTGSCILFAKFPQNTGKSTLLSKTVESINKHRHINGSVNIFNGEAYKHYKTSFAIFAIIGLIILGYSNLTENLDITYTDISQHAYNNYMTVLEGELNEEKYQYIENEQQYFDNLQLQQTLIANDNSLSKQEKEQKLSSISIIFENKGKAFNDVLEQVEYSEEKSEQLGKSPALINELVNTSLTQDTFREWKYFTLLLAVVIFCTSNIFACDYKNSMINLMRANKYGKGRLLLAKLATVFLTTIISYILIYLPYMINFVNTFSASSFDLPLAYARNFNMLSSSVTVFEYILILSALHLGTAMIVTTFIYMMSYLLKSYSITLVVSSGMFLIPCIVFMGNSEVRMVRIFQNDIWIKFTLISAAILICVIMLSLIITLVGYNNLRRRRKNVKP
ncbi:MAG: hypothetical protein J1E85_00535 [Ruminococcus sp.]|nr:hypothetical protein [Ruminococcus sp.]